MRPIFLILCLIFFGNTAMFSQDDPPPSPAGIVRKDSSKQEGVVSTDSQPPPPPRALVRPSLEKPNLNDVVEILLEKPNWLYPADSCPADVIAEKEVEVQYLQEGCKDNPLKCLAKCKNEDGNACYSLALLLQDEKGSDKEYNEALFLKACKFGISSGCTNRAAAILNVEDDSEKNRKCVAKTFEITCEREDSWGCAMYGIILLRGIGRSINLEEAKKSFKKACEITNGEGEACEAANEFNKKLDEEPNREETVLNLQEND